MCEICNPCLFPCSFPACRFSMRCTEYVVVTGNRNPLNRRIIRPALEGSIGPLGPLSFFPTLSRCSSPTPTPIPMLKQGLGPNSAVALPISSHAFHGSRARHCLAPITAMPYCTSQTFFARRKPVSILMGIQDTMHGIFWRATFSNICFCSSCLLDLNTREDIHLKSSCTGITLDK